MGLRRVFDAVMLIPQVFHYPHSVTMLDLIAPTSCWAEITA